MSLEIMIETRELGLNNKRRVQKLISPKLIREKIPRSDLSEATVLNSRKVIANILDGKDDRLLVIVGPCSIDNPSSAIEFATRLNRLSENKKLSEKVYFVMRTYFEKPRTTVGWTGLANNPEGLVEARRLLNKITGIGVPCATEFLDSFVHNYISSFASWGAIGARNNQSQIHRQFVSDLKMPIGFKNPTEGKIHSSVNSVIAAGKSQDYYGLDEDGNAAFISWTTGNKYAHLILRGTES